MKHNILLLCLTFFFLQSCYTYQTATINSMETKKNYVVQLKRGGKDMEGKYISQTTEIVTFRVNKTNIEVPKSEITSIRRKKVSALMIAGTAATITVGTILLIDSSNDNKSEIDAIPSPNN